MKELKIFKNKHIYILIIALIPLLFIYVGDSYDWEGDTALMLRQAENISKGLPFYESDFIYNSEYPVLSPPYYPPITPLMLSGVYHFFGHDIHAYLVLESILYFLFGILVFLFTRRYLKDWMSIIITILLLYNQYVFRVKLEIMSDVPFAFLVMLFFVLLRFDSKRRFLNFAIAGIVGALAIQTRSIGYALPLTVLGAVFFKWVFSGFSWKDNKKFFFDLGIVFASMMTTLFILKLLFNPPLDGVSIYSSIFSSLSLDIILQNLKLYALLFADVMISPLNGWGILSVVARIMLLIVMVIGLFKIDYQRFILPMLFAAIYMAVLIVYPYQSAGVRFYIPILPFLIIVFVSGFQFLITLVSRKKLKTAIVVVFLLGEMVIAIKGHYYFNVYKNPSALTTETTLEGFDNIKKLTNETDIIETSFPRIVAFYTGRKSYSSGRYATYSQYINNRNRFGATYFLHSKKYSYKSESLLMEKKSELVLIWQNEEYQLFQFK